MEGEVCRQVSEEEQQLTSVLMSIRTPALCDLRTEVFRSRFSGLGPGV